MNIQSILIGVDNDDEARVLAYILTDDMVLSVEICERENVGLMGWWPVKGDIIATYDVKETFETICFASDYLLRNVELYDSFEDFKKYYGKYAKAIEEMKVKNDTVVLPQMGGIEYGCIG